MLFTLNSLPVNMCSNVSVPGRRHCGDVIMGAIASQITSLTIVYSTVIQAQIKENIKALRHWPLCGEFTGDQWIPRTNGQLRGKCFHLMTSSWWARSRTDPVLAHQCASVQTATAQWAWWSTYSLTLPRMVRRIAPKPRDPTTISFGFISLASSHIHTAALASTAL